LFAIHATKGKSHKQCYQQPANCLYLQVLSDISQGKILSLAHGSKSPQGSRLFKVRWLHTVAGISNSHLSSNGSQADIISYLGKMCH